MKEILMDLLVNIVVLFTLIIIVAIPTFTLFGVIALLWWCPYGSIIFIAAFVIIPIVVGVGILIVDMMRRGR